MAEPIDTTRPRRSRLILFASGDFACNLYWQSLSLYLFFFYTDALRLAPAVAGLVVMAGSLWDGIADLLVGIAAQRARGANRRYVLAGAVPLGVTFVALYRAPPLSTGALAALALITHLLFRTCYAVVNVPYAAWSVDVSRDSGDRATIAGWRMIFGTAASMLVALITQRLAAAADGHVTSTPGFLLTAALFAAAGTALLLVVGWLTPDRGAADRPGAATPSIRACARALAANPAFVTLNLAMTAIALATTALTRSVLYYFTYVLRDPRAGSAALALMGLAGALVLPGWMLLNRRLGNRGVWLAAAVLGLAILATFAALGGDRVGTAQVFLIVMQMALIGFHFAFWAMLPDTVEYGEHHRAVRVDALTFGVAALVHKVGLGIAAGLIGLAYQWIGYVADTPMAASTQHGVRWIMLGGTAAGIALSALAMLANPLRRDTHAAIIAALDRRAG